MKIADLFKIDKPLEIASDFEKRLLKGRRKKRISGLALLITFIINLVIVVWESDMQILLEIVGYIRSMFAFIGDLFDSSLSWEEITESYKIVPIAILFYILLILALHYLYIILRRNFIEHSEEPFQYTFSIDPFEFTSKNLDEKNLDEDPVLFTMKEFRELFHHDLREKLTERIGRLSLLELQPGKEYSNLSSHIDIKGNIALRKDGKCTFVQVMPKIRIGGLSEPYAVISSVKVEVKNDTLVNAINYKQALEWLYSQVASEIYKQINKDLKEKVKLFPTRFLKGSALYFEAADFAKSNTIDAYDLAMDLYFQAERLMKLSFRKLSGDFLKLSYYTGKFLHIRLPHWLIDKKYHRMNAKILNGYALCYTYRAAIATFTGREAEPDYAITERMTRSLQSLLMIHNLLTPKKSRVNIDEFSIRKWDISEGQVHNRISEYSEELNATYATLGPDTFWKRRILRRPSEKIMIVQKNILFETFVVLSLIHDDAVFRMKKYLALAESVAPEYVEKDQLFLLSKAMLEGNINTKLRLLARAIRADEKFELTSFHFARWTDLQFRYDNEIYWERCKYVIEKYEHVLSINPGNILALASEAYLYWLTDKLQMAVEILHRAKEIKTIIHKTFIAPINYSLARIAAENGEFNKAYDHYREAIFSEPKVAAAGDYYKEKQRIGLYFYDYIGTGILSRYERFKDSMECHFELIKSYYCKEELEDLRAVCRAIKEEIQRNNILSPFISQYLELKENKELKDSIESYISGKSINIDEQDFRNEIRNLLNYVLKAAIEKREGIEDIQRMRKHMDSRFKIQQINKISFIDNDGSVLTEKTLNGLISFVYNDYGNACTNCFNRFGEKKYWEDAKRAYLNAVEFDSSNKVAHFNLATLYISKSYTHEAYLHLSLARKIDPEWIIPVHNLARDIKIVELGFVEPKQLREEGITTEDDNRMPEEALKK